MYIGVSAFDAGAEGAHVYAHVFGTGVTVGLDRTSIDVLGAPVGWSPEGLQLLVLE